MTGKPDEVGRQHNDSRRKHNDPIPLSSEASPGLFEGDIVPDYESISKAYGPKVAQELEEEGLMVKDKPTSTDAGLPESMELCKSHTHLPANMTLTPLR